MTRTVTVHVTQAHIDAGVRDSCRTCPIALALHESGFPEALVNREDWERYDAGLKSDVTLLSRAARSFVRRFDAGLPVKPTTFRLRLPEEAS